MKRRAHRRRIDEFECTDGKCINSTKKCNDEFDCNLPDRSDEINCTYIQPCPEGNHKCETGECVNNQTECPIVTSILSLSSTIAIDIQSSFVLPTTSSKLISATSHSNSYTLMKSSQNNLLETWSDASLSSTVIQLSSISTLPERLSTAALSSDTQNTYNLQSSSAFVSSSHSIKPTTTHLPYQTSVIDTTPTYPVKTPPTEDHKPDEESNKLLSTVHLFTIESCNITEFACSSGECISKEARCDNAFNCLDRSDEINCCFLLLNLEKFPTDGDVGIGV
ncbi:unnamed protein product [Mytilus coruscus]|uniref:LRP2 n=1 Tax=Mytilus coruscus TaxID=42192 RepID=A0A6J7ZZN0_MYTCO|nr:unnamed protein product [Mytilus coruscus]